MGQTILIDLIHPCLSVYGLVVGVGSLHSILRAVAAYSLIHAAVERVLMFGVLPFDLCWRSIRSDIVKRLIVIDMCLLEVTAFLASLNFLLNHHLAQILGLLAVKLE